MNERDERLYRLMRSSTQVAAAYCLVKEARSFLPGDVAETVVDEALRDAAKKLIKAEDELRALIDRMVDK